MKISVVIPTYNEEKYIRKTLESLISQSRKADEIIIVDNNCIDNTIEIAKEYPVRIIKEKRQGMTPARNKGFNQAKYEIIARLDADTRPPKDWLKNIENILKRNQEIDALTGPIIFFDTPLRNTFFSKIYVYLSKMIFGYYILLGPNMALRKSIWEKVKNKVCIDDKKVHEDIDLAIHINQVGGKILYDKTVVSYISARRIKHNPLSFGIEYPIRILKMLISHRRK